MTTIIFRSVYRDWNEDRMDGKESAFHNIFTIWLEYAFTTFDTVFCSSININQILCSLLWSLLSSDSFRSPSEFRTRQYDEDNEQKCRYVKRIEWSHSCILISDIPLTLSARRSVPSVREDKYVKKTSSRQYCYLWISHRRQHEEISRDWRFACMTESYLV